MMEYPTELPVVAQSARTVLARKGSLRRAEDGAPLRTPLRSGLKEDDDGRLRRMTLPSLASA
jgi:hypothetical protein